MEEKVGVEGKGFWKLGGEEWKEGKVEIDR